MRLRESRASRRRRAGSIAARLLAALALLAPPVARATSPQVDVHGDRVTARFDDTPLADAVGAIARAASAEVDGGVVTARTVTVALDDVPLQQAFERVMAGESFTLVYQSGELKTVRLVGTPAAEPAPTRPAFVVTPSTTSLSQAVSRHPAIPIHGTLAMALRADRVTLAQLGTEASQNPDPAVRALAVDAGLAAVERDPQLRDLALGTLATMDGPALAALAEGLVGEPAREIVQRVLARASNAALRQRAAAALAALPAAGAE